jgi:hypothetical protein
MLNILCNSECKNSIGVTVKQKIFLIRNQFPDKPKSLGRKGRNAADVGLIEAWPSCRKDKHVVSKAISYHSARVFTW